MTSGPLPTDGSPRRTLFREEQRFRQPWIWALLALVVAGSWWGFVQQIVLGRPFGSNPAPDIFLWVIAILFGIGLPWLMLGIRLLVEVDGEGVTVRFRPFRTRRIPANEIVSARAVVYRPLADYGGWGIRYSFKRGWAYTVRGKEGVSLDLADGKSLLIGSARAEALAAAIHDISGRKDES